MNNLISSIRHLGAAALVVLGGMSAPAFAQDTVCASVKIQIKQELTMERQAFDAEMKINNTTDNGTIENVSVVVKVMEQDGTPVALTEDPNATGAKFFIRVSHKDKISDVTGTGAVAPATTAIINWLIIPAPGSAGANPSGKKYLIGATLRYRFGGEEQTLEVSPDVVTVKPLPLLTLDYFLPSEVEADDPVTLPVEPVVPFNLGVRVKNNGFAPARNMKIDSAQPKIVENVQGLLVNFQITGSSIDDAPAQNTLLLNFGDIAASTSKTGRWVMESTLSGRFTEFNASFSHADELGGAVTSILQATNAHLLIRDVRVDLPGRDLVRDFLAKDGEVIRVYESEGLDTIVTDRSGVAQLQTSGSGGTASYRLTIPPTDGFVYVKLPDPFGGTKALGTVMRSDAKLMPADNVWLSRSRNAQSKEWEYFVNFFDVNTPGIYESSFEAPAPVAQAPVIQFIADKVVRPGQQVAFMVEASSPQNSTVSLSAAPLPAGATFVQQPSSPGAGTGTGTATGTVTVNLARAAFSWTPGTGTAGDYLITYTATDGALSSNRSARIKVEADTTPAPGPGTPDIHAPLPGAQVTVLRPELAVVTSAAAQDPTIAVEFELYADEALTQVLGSATVARSTVSGSGTAVLVVPTVWQVPVDLADDNPYWWRARASDGTRFSLWASSYFGVNQNNDAPGSFNLTHPVPDAEVATRYPVLSWTNAPDSDGDTVTYVVQVYQDSGLTTSTVTSPELQPDASGATQWTVTAPLTNHAKYYWRVVARDPQGAQTVSPARMFQVHTGNLPPTQPVAVSPPNGGDATSADTLLTIQNSTDGDLDLLTYVFEIDTVSTFDSANRRSSGQVMGSMSGSTSWPVTGLVENQMYHWRVKAQDGRAESAWMVSSFLMNAVNDPPPQPTISNPGNQAWVASQQPSLQVNPVQDPEQRPVRYQFEVYDDAALANRVADGISPTTAWMSSALADKNTYYWRARALDSQDAASAWTPASVMYVSTGPYQDPTIRVTAPNIVRAPRNVKVDGVQRQRLTIRWQGTDPNIEPTVALYYDTSKAGFNGTLIVDGLRQEAGTQTGSYVWDVSHMAPGVYYIYAAIYDSRGMGKAYAAGALVMPASPQAGFLVQDSPGRVRITNENGKTATIRMRLGRKPTQNVVVPLSSSKLTEGTVQPQALTFTPANWNQWQVATVTGIDDCAPDGRDSYQIVVGKAQSLDPHYIGVTGEPYEIANRSNAEARSSTDNPNIFLCGMTVVLETQLERRLWEYKLRADLTNIGPDLTSIKARLVGAAPGHTIIEPLLQYGAVGRDEMGHTNGTITIQTRNKVAPQVFKTGNQYRWAITVTP
ncbi:MAG: hypothetical protein AB7P37_11905 [Ramlibacter sp.]